MTLSGSIDDSITTSGNLEHSINLNSLYCSHLWKNSQLRSAIIAAPSQNRDLITYCYTCKGKIRKYELKPQRKFNPHNQSTPIKDVHLSDTTISQAVFSYNRTDSESTNVDNKLLRIPSISQQIDLSFRQKYASYEMDLNNSRRERLRKSLRGFGCIVNFASAGSPVKKRTQIQACSISVMIVAIVIISFLLVNFTKPNFKGMTDEISTTVVPRKNIETDETAAAITTVYFDLPPVAEITSTEEYFTTKESTTTFSNENSTVISIISKIRKNIRTFPKYSSKSDESAKFKEVNNRDLSQRFCSCQRNEICMLDENTGTSVCREPIDNDDPTGTSTFINIF